MRINWEYIAESKVIADTEDRIVMYGDDVNKEVLQSVCSMWNSGDSEKQIQSYLDKGTNLCTLEEADYIMEQIEIYKKQVPVVDQVEKEVVENTVQEGVVEQKLAAETHIVKPPVVDKKTRTPRTTRVAKVSGKVDPAELLLKMREQIRCIESISSVAIDIDTEGLSKGARDVVIDFLKEIETMKSLAITTIQAL